LAGVKVVAVAAAEASANNELRTLATAQPRQRPPALPAAAVTLFLAERGLVVSA